MNAGRWTLPFMLFLVIAGCAEASVPQFFRDLATELQPTYLSRHSVGYQGAAGP